MKTDIFQKPQFLRKRFKHILIFAGISAVFYVLNQLFYLKVLNEEIVGKQITGSVQAPHHIVAAKVHSKWNEPLHSKIIRDKDGRTVSLRGTRDDDVTKYLPNKRGKFVCFSSKTEIDFNKINDNYCDCPLDGSDEPGTNACNTGVFNCDKSSAKFAAKIPSYKVNDGYCDCCDGSDEWAEAALSYALNESGGISYRRTKCRNRC